MWLKARVARFVPFATRYAEVAPACCNACRTCTTNNVIAFAGMIGAAIAAPVLRLVRPRAS
jgi:hypothetical protein